MIYVIFVLVGLLAVAVGFLGLRVEHLAEHIAKLEETKP